MRLLTTGYWLLEKHHRALHLDHHHARLVASYVFEAYDAAIGPRCGFALLQHLTLDVKRIAVKHGKWVHDLFITQVCHDGALCEFRHADADQESEREDAIHNRTSELGMARKICVQVQGLRVHGQPTEEHIIHLGDGAPRRVLDDLTDDKLFKVFAGHKWRSQS